MMSSSSTTASVSQAATSTSRTSSSPPVSLFELPVDLLVRAFSHFLDIVDVARLDSAVLSSNIRYQVFLVVLFKRSAVFFLDFGSAMNGISPECWRWISMRRIHLNSLALRSHAPMDHLFAVQCSGVSSLRVENVCDDAIDKAQQKNISAIINKCTSLRGLSVDLVNIEDTAFASTFENCAKSLEALRITNIMPFIAVLTDSIIKTIVTNCCNLKSLELNDCSQCTSETLLQMAKSFKMLESLELLNLKFESEEDGVLKKAALLQIIRKCGHSLQNFMTNHSYTFHILDMPHNDDDDFYVAIAQHCPQLISLTSCFYRVSDIGINALVASLKVQLEVLDIVGDMLLDLNNLSSDSFHSLLDCSDYRLHMLYFSNVFMYEFTAGGDSLELFSGDAIPANCTLQSILDHLPQLKSLTLDTLPFIDELVIASVGERLSKLSSLSLSNLSEISDGAFESLAPHLLNLEGLSLMDLPLITDKTLLSLAQHCNSVQCLTLVNMHISNQGFIAFAKANEGLRNIDITNAVAISDASLFALSLYCAGLKCLRFKRCPGIYDPGVLEALVRSTSIDRIHIHRCGNLICNNNPPMAGRMRAEIVEAIKAIRNLSIH